MFFFCCSKDSGVRQRHSGTKKQPNEYVLGADIRRTSMRISQRTSGGKSFGQALEAPGKKHFGADVHDPKSRMSMTPGWSKKTSVRKLRAEFSFPRHSQFFFAVVLLKTRSVFKRIQSKVEEPCRATLGDKSEPLQNKMHACEAR